MTSQRLALRLLLCLALTATGGLWGTAVAQSADLRYRVAVLDFDVNDLSGQVVSPQGLGRAMATEFQTPLVRSGRFTVITRLDLEKVLDELALGPTGILNPDQVQAFGEIAGVDIIITGNITVFSNSSYSISATFINVATGEVAHAATLRVGAPEEFLDAAQGFVEGALVRFPLQGAILAIEGAEVYINIGIVHGLTAVDKSGLIYRPRQVAERSIPVRIGTFTIEQVYQDVAVIAPSVVDGYTLQVGDVVVVQPLEDPRGVGPFTGLVAVDIALSPPHAVVLLDGVATALPLQLEPGVHELVVRADGYEETRLEADTRAGEPVSLAVRLEPLPATLVFTGVETGYSVEVDGRSYGEVGEIRLPPGDHVVGVIVGSAVHTEEVTLGPGETREVFVAGDPPEPPAAAAALPSAATPATVPLPTSTTRPGAPGDVTLAVVSNASPVHLVLEGQTTVEVEVAEGMAELSVPAGLYLVRAESPGRGPIDTVVAVDTGEVTLLELVFDDVRFIAVPGPYRTPDGVGTIVWVVVDGMQAAAGETRLVVFGPPGWNRNLPMSLPFDPVGGYVVLSRDEYAPGTYRFQLVFPTRGPLTYESTVGAASPLALVERVQLAATPARDGVVATWSPVPDAASYVVDLTGSAAASATTTATTSTLGVAVTGGSEFRLCLSALSWDPSAPFDAGIVVSASTDCRAFSGLVRDGRVERGEDPPGDGPSGPQPPGGLPPIPPPPP